jgi:hypothetical protein
MILCCIALSLCVGMIAAATAHTHVSFSRSSTLYRLRLRQRCNACCDVWTVSERLFPGRRLWSCD